LLLNEFQKEHGVVEAQSAELAQLKKEMAAMAEAIERLERDRMVADAR
jgi:cell division protein FtsB